MKKLSAGITSAVGILISHTTAFAAGGPNYLGVTNDRLRTWDVGFADVPIVIVSVTLFLLKLSATIAVAVIIYGALKMALWAIPGDKDSGKKLVSAAIVWFLISTFGWAIINILINNI